MFKKQQHTLSMLKGLRLSGLLALLLSIFAFSANAATKTWASTTTGGTWATAASWSPSGVPVAVCLQTKVYFLGIYKLDTFVD